MAESADKKEGRSLDILGALGILGIVGMMIIPLPTWAISLFLVVNIALSVTVLLLALSVKDILEFSVFPSALLGLTLFRLALNVASTKLILLQGDAGAIVDAFGKIVVRGDAVVGFVVFLILVVVQFIVITKGAERVSEVAARFTLDALPGKQMGVDAELNAGLIDEKQARSRREAIQREADFYGAMDGASKFVRGDALASIFTVVINIVGGATVGILRRNMDWTDVLGVYTTLTIGDGLAHQIPALIVSTAAGILVTRSASKSPLGQELYKQISAQPRTLSVAAGAMGVLGGLGFAVGIPAWPFLFAAAGLWTISRLGKKKQTASPGPSLAEEKPAAKGPEDVTPLLAVETLEVELGYGLLFLVDQARGGDLLDRIAGIRRQCARDLGIVVPPVRIRDNSYLSNNGYAFKIRGAEVARGELLPKQWLAMGPLEGSALAGTPGLEPTFGLPALWIKEDQRRAAEMEGLTVVDNASVIATHLTETIKTYAHELLGRQDVQNLLNDLKTRGQTALLEELIPTVLPVGSVQRMLQNLLQEKISIRNLTAILESISEGAAHTKDVEILTEFVRAGLARQISQQNRDEAGVLPCVIVSPETEKTLSESLQRNERGSRLLISPDVADALARNLVNLLDAGGADRRILLCSASLRPALRRLLDRHIPRLTVLSYNELTSDTKIKTLGSLSLSAAPGPAGLGRPSAFESLGTAGAA